MMMVLHSTASLVSALKAAAEPTRLRILALLRSGPLTVKDLTRILGQSQPRLSRHLKLLAEAGLVERAPEGSWVFFHLSQDGRHRSVATHLLASLDAADPVLVRDQQRVEAVKRDREAAAQAYFDKHAAEWDRIRALHVAETEVEAAIRAAIGPRTSEFLVDLGTGTGRILELCADRYTRGVGFDLSPAMLSYARNKLARSGVQHAQVRQSDIFNVPLADNVAGVVVMHQILHFLADPQRAVAEAARILAPGGKLLIVDFAPHNLEFVRDTYAHERLGFADTHIKQWLAECGLRTVTTKHLRPKANDGPDKLTVSLWQTTKVLDTKVISATEKLERVS
jgi:ubiquinone/menaquinone biosynthesis C-methylase UbiE/DNA-binding transcriptional ArsR family regulator